MASVQIPTQALALGMGDWSPGLSLALLPLFYPGPLGSSWLSKVGCRRMTHIVLAVIIFFVVVTTKAVYVHCRKQKGFWK